jgi:hypothetical protein
VRLIVFAAVLTAGALAATILVWRRSGLVRRRSGLVRRRSGLVRRRWGLLIRPVGVLLTELLLTLTVGLVVNRSQQFYPSWAALLAGSGPDRAGYHTSAGRLDAWLAARPGAGRIQSFPWRPAGWTSWHLAAAPTVTVPAGYLADPGRRYSAVLLGGARPWPAPTLTGPTVLVNVTTTARTAAAALAVALPGELGRDLRVTGHRWALVTSAADNALARRVAVLARGVFPSLAFVGTAAPAHTRATSPRPAGIRTAYFTAAAKTGHAATKTGPATAKTGPTTTRTGPATAKTGPAATKTGPATAKTGPTTTRTGPATTRSEAGPLEEALAWAADQTPPPLAASAPEPTYLPPAPKRTHHAKAEPRRGNHGSGQPHP